MFIKKKLFTRDWNWKHYFAAFYIKLKTIWHWNDCRVSVMFIVFNATFNNSSIISWWPVLLVDETGVPGENHRPVASHWQTLSHNVVSGTPRHEWRFTIEIVVYLKYIEVSNKCLSTNIQLSNFLSTNYKWKTTCLFNKKGLSWSLHIFVSSASTFWMTPCEVALYINQQWIYRTVSSFYGLIFYGLTFDLNSTLIIFIFQVKNIDNLVPLSSFHSYPERMFIWW